MFEFENDNGELFDIIEVKFSICFLYFVVVICVIMLFIEVFIKCVFLIVSVFINFFILWVMLLSE